MRNPNYEYDAGSEEIGGWWAKNGAGISVWGKTKAAARSRLLRVLRHNEKLTANQAKQEEVNDQS
jgi:hypothetical protein